MLETKCLRIQSVGPKNIKETAKSIVNQIFNLDRNLIPFCIPLTVDIEKIIVKPITIPTCKNKESETYVNRPAALLSCKLKNPSGPTVPAMAATTHNPSAKSPIKPLENFSELKGINKLRGLKEKPF